MKTSNKILTLLLLLAVGPTLFFRMAAMCRTAGYRETVAPLATAQVRVIDGRGLAPAAAPKRCDGSAALFFCGIPAAGEVALRGDTLVLRGRRVRALSFPGAEALLLTDTTIRSPFRSEAGEPLVRTFVCEEPGE